MIIWDSGTYDTEKFHDARTRGGHRESARGRILGRYALIRPTAIGGRRHRLKNQKDQKVLEFDNLAPMLATHVHGGRSKGQPGRSKASGTGYRLLVEADHGAVRLRSRSGRDVTAEYPQLRHWRSDLADHHVVLDGEAVVLDSSCVPSSARWHRGRDTVSSSGRSTCST